MKIRIATRKSALALWQAEHVADALNALPEVDAVDLVPMSTRGDEILDKSLQKLADRAEMPDGFCIAAVLERANHADAFVGRDGCVFDTLPEGACIGSSSLRRQAQLKLMRPDVRIEPLRGNVNTRLSKLDNGDFDAIILAAAGLERLGLQHYISQQFTPDEMLPAAAQGVIGIECLEDNAELRAVLEQLNHAPTVQTTAAERAIAKTLDASCQSPVATHAVIDGSAMIARATATSCCCPPDSWLG